ncbi:hypothetical protein O3G_MSEX012381 [Manduca sexta]|uniref:U1-type domain-containing protein n=1 Tax=Manduca sexta TaxID=7130 RepID=A0A921ZPI7_MANSE|nr:hypothetical protein O3G_MSEX012381 [Manduca sexta]
MFGMNYNPDGVDMDEEYGYDDGPRFHPIPKFNRNDRYGNAYGNYRGGYARGGMSRPPMRPMGPPMQSVPPLRWGPTPPVPPPPPTIKSTLEDKAIRFLARCGVSKDAVKNYPEQLLLMFAPDHCGLCSQDLDSFNTGKYKLHQDKFSFNMSYLIHLSYLFTARLHYLSKGHMKNQRKWLSKHFKGCVRPKEIPLKSRDLYCELCDIQITSKQHADSHYEGRPHRATVEGRKEPRNKALTLLNMQDRLAQLIRREKKFIKPNNEAAKAVGGKPKETKEIPPELCCNICKTTVTCSDQMTTHLNGKRHLAKEKQHILKMMKSGKVVEISENAQSAAKNAEEKEEKEVKGDAENDSKEKEDFDWGKGSESWEENTTKDASLD